MALCFVAWRAFSISHPQGTALGITGQKGAGSGLQGKEKLGKSRGWLETMVQFSKCDSLQSNVVEDFLRVPLIAGFLYRLSSSTVCALLRGYGVNPKIKVSSSSYRRRWTQFCIEEMCCFHKEVVLRKRLHQVTKMACMQLERNEDWGNGEEAQKIELEECKTRAGCCFSPSLIM